MPPTDLVDTAEGRRITGLAPATLYKLARQGRIRSYKVLGTALRFNRTDLLALVEERQPLVAQNTHDGDG